ALFICRLHDVFCKVGRIEYNPQVVATSSAIALTTTPSTPLGSAASASIAISAAEEAEEAKILATGLVNAEIVDHPSLPQLVAEFHNTKLYKKGDTLARLC